MSLPDLPQYSDPRWQALGAKPYEVDENKMEIFFAVQTDEGEELRTLPAKYCVCHVCRGQGKHVNPNIDDHGLTVDDFTGDPDFAEAYLAGRYDVTCYECHGKRVCLDVDPKAAKDQHLDVVLKEFYSMLDDEAAYAAERASERRMGA